jgi:hypothetical protein
MTSLGLPTVICACLFDLDGWPLRLREHGADVVVSDLAEPLE